MRDDDSTWWRPLMIGVAALLGVAVLIGGVLGVMALGAVTVTGLGGADSRPDEDPSLYIPSPSPTPEEDDEGQGDGDGQQSEDERSQAQQAKDGGDKDKKKSKKERRQRRPITLQAQPQQVAPMQRINLTGRYRGGNGTTLQVQRRQGGGWSDFPTSARVSGGTFRTWVQTGQSGPNRFRVIDKSTGRSSKPVVVRVG